MPLLRVTIYVAVRREGRGVRLCSPQAFLVDDVPGVGLEAIGHAAVAGA